MGLKVDNKICLEFLREKLIGRYCNSVGITEVRIDLFEPEIISLHNNINEYLMKNIEGDQLYDLGTTVGLSTVRRIIQRKYNIKTSLHHRQKPTLNLLAIFIRFESWDDLVDKLNGTRFTLQSAPDLTSTKLLKKLVIVLTLGKKAELQYYRKGTITELEEVKKYFSFEALEMIKARREFFEKYHLTIDNPSNPSSYILFDISLSNDTGFPSLDLLEHRFLFFYSVDFKKYTEHYTSFDDQTIYFKLYKKEYKIISVCTSERNRFRALPVNYNDEHYISSTMAKRMKGIYDRLFDGINALDTTDKSLLNIKKFFRRKQSYFDRLLSKKTGFEKRPATAAPVDMPDIKFYKTKISSLSKNTSKQKKQPNKSPKRSINDNFEHLPQGESVELPFDVNPPLSNL